MKSEKAMINQPLLEQDIIQIRYYGNEEYKALKEICSKFKEVNIAYDSSLNTALFLNNVHTFESSVDTILGKRMEYANTLEHVILQYNMLSDDSNKIFGDIV